MLFFINFYKCSNLQILEHSDGVASIILILFLISKATPMQKTIEYSEKPTQKTIEAVNKIKKCILSVPKFKFNKNYEIFNLDDSDINNNFDSKKIDTLYETTKYAIENPLKIFDEVIGADIQDIQTENKKRIFNNVIYIYLLLILNLMIDKKFPDKMTDNILNFINFIITHITAMLKTKLDLMNIIQELGFLYEQMKDRKEPCNNYKVAINNMFEIIYKLLPEHNNQLYQDLLKYKETLFDNSIQYIDSDFYKKNFEVTENQDDSQLSKLIEQIQQINLGKEIDKEIQYKNFALKRIYVIKTKKDLLLTTTLNLIKKFLYSIVDFLIKNILVSNDNESVKQISNILNLLQKIYDNYFTNQEFLGNYDKSMIILELLNDINNKKLDNTITFQEIFSSLSLLLKFLEKDKDIFKILQSKLLINRYEYDDKNSKIFQFSEDKNQFANIKELEKVIYPITQMDSKYKNGKI